MASGRSWLLAFVALTIVSVIGFAYYYQEGESVLDEVKQPASQTPTSKVIKVGVFSSSQSNYPIYRFLAEQARQDFNDLCNRTGIDARLEVTLGDAEGQAANAKKFTVKCYDDGIRVIVGFGWSSFFCSSAYSYANSNETSMILFSPSSTSPTYHRADNVFRLCEDDSAQARVLVDLLKERGVKSIVIIARQDSWAETQIRENIEPLFTALGGVVEADIRYPADLVVFEPYMQGLHFNVTDAALLDSHLAEAEKAIDGAEEDHPGKAAVVLLGFDETGYILNATSSHPALGEVPWFGMEGTANSSIIPKLAPSVASTVRLLSPRLRNPETELSKRLAVGFAASGMTAGVGEGSLLAYTNMNIYDCVMIAALSLLRANTTDVATICDMIPVVASTYNGATGPVVLDEMGDRVGIDYDIWGYAAGGTPAIFGRFEAATGTFTWDPVLAEP